MFDFIKCIWEPQLFTYEIKIDGSTQASYQTLDNSSAGNASSITTDNIATELYNDLVAALTGYTIERDGSIISTTPSSLTSSEWITNVEDSQGTSVW